MDWKTIIADLAEYGWKQTELADKCGCSQSTISEISKGEIKDPAYRIGSVLVSLHQKIPGKKTVRKAA